MLPLKYCQLSFLSALLIFLVTVPMRCFFCWSFKLFVLLVQTVMSVHCSLMVTCRVLLTVLYVVTCCVLLYNVLFFHVLFCLCLVAFWSPAGNGLAHGLPCLWCFL